MAGNALHHFRSGHDLFGRPTVGSSDVHILDESNNVPTKTKVLCQWDDVLIIHPPLYHHVNLDWLEPGLFRMFYGAENAVGTKANTVYSTKARLIKGVYTNPLSDLTQPPEDSAPGRLIARTHWSSTQCRRYQEGEPIL
jgi:hypothetical protein